jgi:hypothetical protein
MLFLNDTVDPVSVFKGLQPHTKRSVQNKLSRDLCSVATIHGI